MRISRRVVAVFHRADPLGRYHDRSRLRPAAPLRAFRGSSRGAALARSLRGHAAAGRGCGTCRRCVSTIGTARPHDLSEIQTGRTGRARSCCVAKQQEAKRQTLDSSETRTGVTSPGPTGRPHRFHAGRVQTAARGGRQTAPCVSAAREATLGWSRNPLDNEPRRLMM